MIRNQVHFTRNWNSC